MKFDFLRVNRWVLIPLSQLLFGIWLLNLISLDALPNPVAIHWGITGQADGFLPLENYWLVPTTSFFLTWLVQLLFLWLLRKTPIIRKFIDGVITCVYWLLFLIMTTATGSQINIDSSLDSTFPVWFIAVLFLLLPLSLWFALAFPKVEIGDDLVVRIRGVKFLTVKALDLIDAEITEMSPWKYGGLGVRASGKTLAFVPNKGKGVLFLLRSGESIAIRSDSPENLLSQAKNLIKRNSA